MRSGTSYYTNVTKNECYVLFATVRLLLDGWLQSCFGYSKGQLHVDFTFKLLQEQIPFFVSSVPPTWTSRSRQHVR